MWKSRLSRIFKPDWRLTYGIEDVLNDIYECNVEQWLAVA